MVNVRQDGGLGDLELGAAAEKRRLLRLRRARSRVGSEMVAWWMRAFQRCLFVSDKGW